LIDSIEWKMKTKKICCRIQNAEHVDALVENRRRRRFQSETSAQWCEEQTARDERVAREMTDI